MSLREVVSKPTGEHLAETQREMEAVQASASPNLAHTAEAAQITQPLQ